MDTKVTDSPEIRLKSCQAINLQNEQSKKDSAEIKYST